MKFNLFITLLFFYLLGYSQSPKQHYDKSVKLTENLDYTEALKEINKAIEVDSLNRKYLLHKISVLYYSSECNEGLELLKKIVFLENKFDDETISYYADLTDCIGKVDVATEVLEEYVKENQSPEILARLGQRYFNMGDIEKSVYYYKLLTEITPNDIDAIIDLSKILFAANRYEESYTELVQGLNNNKDNLKLLVFLASYYDNTRQYEKAIEVENKILSIEYLPKHLASRALLYEKTNNAEKAYQDYYKIIEIVPCNLDYYNKILQYEFENKLYNKLIKNSFTFIECDKANKKNILNGLYMAYCFIGEIDKAKPFINEKLKLNPLDFHANYFKALILIRENNYEDAYKYLESISYKTENISVDDRKQIEFLKSALLLAQEKYKEFVGLWKALESNDTALGLSEFDYTFGDTVDKTKVSIAFDSNEGKVLTSVIVPFKAVNLLKELYNVDILSGIDK